jgi:hypothetical protein
VDGDGTKCKIDLMDEHVPFEDSVVLDFISWKCDEYIEDGTNRVQADQAETVNEVEQSTRCRSGLLDIQFHSNETKPQHRRTVIVNMDKMDR